MNRQKIFWDIVLFLAGLFFGNHVAFYNVQHIKHYDAEYKVVQVHKKFSLAGKFFIETHLGKFRINKEQWNKLTPGKKYFLKLPSNTLATALEIL